MKERQEKLKILRNRKISDLIMNSMRDTGLTEDRYTYIADTKERDLVQITGNVRKIQE